MLTGDKITEIYVMADEFCKAFDSMLYHRGFSEPGNDRKRNYHRGCRMSQAEIIVIMIMFHSSSHKWLKHFYLNEICVRYSHFRPLYNRILVCKRAVIETINYELKNIAQIEHTRYRSFQNFVVNFIGGIAAYCLFPKKPMINI